MAISSQGTTFTYRGSVFTVTSIAVNYGTQGGSNNEQRQRVSASYLGSNPDLPEPFFEIWQPDPNGFGRLTGTASQTVVSPSSASGVEIEFLGTTPPAFGTTGALAISGPLSLTFAAATCMSSTIRLAVGDIVRGSASFQVR